MQRLIISLMLLVTATAANAEWTLVDSSAELVQYVDRTTVQRKGNFAKVWNLRDLKKSSKNYQGNYYFSQKALEEYDCVGNKIRLISLVQYGQKMGGGTVVDFQNGTSPWIPVVPQTVGETLWKIACGKK